MPEMHALTIRLPKELHEDLAAVSLQQKRSIASIVRECLEDYTESQPLEEIKELIAAVRALGPVSEEEAVQAAKRAAEMDDKEGFGKVRVTRK